MHFSIFFRNFVPDMTKRFLIIIPMLLLALSMRAELVTLRTGKTIQGTILIQNEEVLIIRDTNGQRYQFPAGEVLTVEETGNREQKTENREQGTEIKEQRTGNRNQGTGDEKKTAFMIELGGGFHTIPHDRIGGAVSGDLIIGSRAIAGREVLLGGQIGYHGGILPATPNATKQTYHFLPIALAFRMPLLDGAHSPLVGASLGYGIGLSKNYTGGIFTELLLGYRYRMPKGNTIFAGADVQFQQARIQATEYEVYTAQLGRNLVSAGIKFAFSF